MGLLKHVTSHGQLDGEDDKPLEFGVPYETKKNHLAATHCTNSSNLVGQIPGLVVSQVLCLNDHQWSMTAYVLGLDMGRSKLAPDSPCPRLAEFHGLQGEDPASEV